MATKPKTPARKRTRKVAPSLGRAAKQIVSARATPAPWFSVTLPKPPSVNGITRNATAKDGRGGRFKTKRYSTWRKEAGWLLLAARPPKIAGVYELRVELGRRKGSDLDNYVKGLSDLLTQCGVIRDDSLAERITIEWGDGLASADARISIRPFVREPAHVR